jgi:glycosyltransferase involved in cell wall biosynthesis
MVRHNQKTTGRKAVVSVLIANYNNGRFLHDAFRSVLGQTYDQWEVVFVDDGSTDDSVAIAREYAENDRRIRVYANGRNRGCGYTKRQCVARSRGDIRGFLDSDDVLAPNALAAMVREHGRYAGVSLVYSDHNICGNDLREICRNVYHEPGSESFLMTVIGVNHFATFKQSYYNKTSGVNASFERAVDRDLYLKLEEVGSVMYLPEPLYYYRIHDNSNSTMDRSRRTEYWAWQARFDACERRDLVKEDIFDEVMKAREDVLICGPLYRSWEYRLGSMLLALPRMLVRALCLAAGRIRGTETAWSRGAADEEPGWDAVR